MARKKKEYVTAIYINCGLIALIEPDGNIGVYRQRGMDKVDAHLMNQLVSMGLVVPNWMQYKELPKYYVISFEDEQIMGKAEPKFKIQDYIKTALYSRDIYNRGVRNYG